MGLFPMNMNVGSGGTADCFCVSIGNGYNQAIYYDGDVVTCAVNQNGYPQLTNPFIDMSTFRILKNCSCYTSTNGATPTKTDYSINDTANLLRTGIITYTFVQR